MTILFEGDTNIGRKRAVNEDSLWPNKPGQLDPYADNPYGLLFIVADGMGGHGAGDVASELATKEISAAYYNPQEGLPDDVEGRLRLAIYLAHQKIAERAGQSSEAKNMGTTIVTAAIKYDEAAQSGQVWVAWAGDSRAYRLRRGVLSQLTRDHSKMWPMIETGQITWEALRFHPERSRITNSLAARRASVTPDIARFDLQPGDQLLLCSDGLTGEVKPEEIEQTLATYNLSAAVRLLIEKANSSKEVIHEGQKVLLEGGDDNITALLVEIPGGPPRREILTVTAPVTAAPVVAKSTSWLGLVMGLGVLILLLIAGLAIWFFNNDQPVQTPSAGPTQANGLDGQPAGDTSGPILVDLPGGATPTASPMPEASTTLAPGETPPSTATRQAIGEATPPPTFTPIPTPTPTITPTLPSFTNTTEVKLLDPIKKILPNGEKKVIFKWQYGNSCQFLSPNTGFLLRVWKNDGLPLGAMDAVNQRAEIQCEGGKYTFEVGNLQSAPGVAGATSGKFYWDIMLVSLDPYQEISAVPFAYFELAGVGGGGGSDGDSNNSSGGGGGPNVGN